MDPYQPDLGSGPATDATPSVSDPRSGPARRYDPLAAALGNATLLGVGYLLLRRRGAAIAAFVTSAVLVLLTASFGQPGWFWRAVLTLWWVATTVHGFTLARRLGSPRPAAPTPAPAAPTADTLAGAAPAPATPAPAPAQPVQVGTDWRQRAIAGSAALVVAAAVTAAVLDLRRVEGAATHAHEAGNCQETISRLNGLAAWHKLVDPYVTRHATDQIEACNRLIDALATDDPAQAATLLGQYLDDDSARWSGAFDEMVKRMLSAAGNDLDDAVAGSADQLQAGFDMLAQVLEIAPDQQDAVHTLVTGYLQQLPDADPCDARVNLDWLRAHSPTGELSFAVQQADEIAPPLLLACGDEKLANDPHGALDAYQSLLDRYPDSDLAGKATTGVGKAQTGIELLDVRALVATGSAYCSTPKPYRAAHGYGAGGQNLLLPLGDTEFADGIPAEWKAVDVAEATLVLCVGDAHDGGVVDTCSYQGDGYGDYQVQFLATVFNVRAFELRTGKLAFETNVTLGGNCPETVHYTCSSYNPLCPPPAQMRAPYSDSAIRNAVAPWVSH